MAMRERAALFAAALWWGSLTALGALFVPLLFKHLGSPATAGAMAARLFEAQTWLSTGCALLLMLSFNRAEDEALQTQGRRVLKWVVAGLLLALLVELAVAPRIVSARAMGASLALWHGLGSAMFLGQWLCATLVLWRMGRRP
jgi:Domain of unknown function (DUF4149)